MISISNSIKINTIQEQFHQLIALTEKIFITTRGLDELQKAINVIDESLLSYKEKAKDNLDELRTANSNVRQQYKTCANHIFEWSVFIKNALDTIISNLKNPDLEIKKKETVWGMTSDTFTCGLDILKTASYDLNKLNGGILLHHLRKMKENLEQDKDNVQKRFNDEEKKHKMNKSVKRQSMFREQDLMEYVTNTYIFKYVGSYFKEDISPVEKALDKAIQIADQFIKDLEKYKSMLETVLHSNSTDKNIAQLLIKNPDLRDDFIPKLEQLQTACLAYIKFRKSSQ